MRRVILGVTMAIAVALSPLTSVYATVDQNPVQDVNSIKNNKPVDTGRPDDTGKPVDTVTPVETVKPDKNPPVVIVEEEEEEEEERMITFCHVPPGNTENPQTLTISVNAAVQAGHFVPNDEGEALVPAGGHGGDYVGACTTEEEEEEEVVTHKVTLCHRTDSVTNPYNKITVSVDAAGNFKDEGNGDHAQHAGPVAVSAAAAQALKDAKMIWGDIIPTGEHNTSLNWTAEGQAIYNNNCAYVTPGQGTTNPPAPVVPQDNPGQGTVTPTPLRTSTIVVTPAVESGIGIIEMLPETSSSDSETNPYKLFETAILSAVMTIIGLGLVTASRRYNLI